MSIALKHYEAAKANIKAEEQGEIAIIRERVVREIQPKYVEIEKMKNEELDKATSDYSATKNSIAEHYNSQLVALQNKYENDKKQIIELAEKRKAEILNSMLQSETYEITTECEKAIAEIDNLIAKLRSKE